MEMSILSILFIFLSQGSTTIPTTVSAPSVSSTPIVTETGSVSTPESITSSLVSTKPASTEQGKFVGN